MWAVNEADLSVQTVSDYVHVVMLHCGLGVRLAVADLLPLLPPPVRRLRAFLDPSKTHKTQTSSSTDILVLLLTSHATDRHSIDALFHDPFRYSKASVNFI